MVNALEKAAEELKKPEKKSSSKEGNNKSSGFHLSFSASAALMIGIFALVVLGAVSHNADPSKFLLSPITLITVLVLFLAMTGVLKLNLITLLIVIGLVILTMYQDDLEDFTTELKWDYEWIKNKLQDVLHIGAGNPDIQAGVKKKFHEKYAEFINETDYYVYVKQIDPIIKQRVGWEDTATHNYFLVILPEIIDIDEGVPLDQSTDQKITLYAIKHEATVPIVYNYKVYTVRARAYLVRFGMFDSLTGLLGLMKKRVPLPGDLAQFIETNVLKYGGRIHGDRPYSEFKADLEKHAYELPDKIFIG